MSFLAPLYVLGGLAVALPILLHLIRQRPKDEQLFSSLLFLKPTPPRLTKRSRLDQWPLLLLRVLAILGLAFAFARPFVREAEVAALLQPSKHLAILIDTSASMSQPAVWAQAIAKAKEALQTVAPNDRVTFIAFNQQPRVMAEIGADTDAAGDGQDAALTSEDLTRLIDSLKPTLAPGDMGKAVVFAADWLSKGDGRETDSDSGVEPSSWLKQLVIVSDFQRSEDNPLQSLQSYTWPKDVAVQLIPVSASKSNNAFIELLSDAPAQSDAVEGKTDTTAAAANQQSLANQAAAKPQGLATQRVRVTNAADADQYEFRLSWGSGQGFDNALPDSVNAVTVQVPPGATRTVSLDVPATQSTPFATLRLVGDQQEFDNQRYLALPPAPALKLLILSDSKAPADQRASYFLSKIPLSEQRYQVEIESLAMNQTPVMIDKEQVPLVVAQNELTDDALKRVRSYLDAGGQLLWMLDAEGDQSKLAASLASLLPGAKPRLSLVADQDYAMWAKIDFQHPLFLPFADPRFNDFTKIRFWKHWQLTKQSLPTGSQVLAEFDDQSPALVEVSVGAGKVWLMLAGWQPTESQLALSTKFVPLVSKLFSSGIAWLNSPVQFVVGVVPAELEMQGQQVLDSQRKELVKLNSAVDWLALDAPGHYYLVDERGEQAMALNIAVSESRAETVAQEQWESLGVPIKPVSESEDNVTVRRQQRDVELERNQGVWQWLILAVVTILIAEGFWRTLVDRRPVVSS